MTITGIINNIQYQPQCAAPLKERPLEGFDINKAQPAVTVRSGETVVAVSKWVSPKRTRSYPYERVYNTLPYPNRAAVIPVVKDEGTRGERDFLQWDTAMMLSLLDVRLVLAYYNAATLRGTSVTNFQFDNEYVVGQLKELMSSSLSVREWNIAQLQLLQSGLMERVEQGYDAIATATGAQMHNDNGFAEFRNTMHHSMEKFMRYSRKKSQQAQQREYVTIQPKEALSTLSKAKVSLRDAWGGEYFLTVDEVEHNGGMLWMIEAKHTAHGLLPSVSDIKDGLLKMILYKNLSDVRADGTPVSHTPTVKLTSRRLVAPFTTTGSAEGRDEFVTLNGLSRTHQSILDALINEARTNGIEIRLHRAE